MAETEVGLVWRLRAEGTREVQTEIQRITGGLTQARTTAGQAPNVSPWKSALGGIHGEAKSLWTTLTKIAGWGGLAAGAFGMRAVVNDFLSLSDVMRGIQSDTGRSDSEIAKLTDRFRNLATEIGKPAAEIAQMADLIKDLGTAFDRATEAAPKLELLAGAFNIKDVEVMATAFAGLEKLSGGKLPVEQQMAMLREIVMATPLSEEATLEAVTRSGGRAATIGRMEGPQGIASLGGILATLGKTYGGQERKIQTGLEAILDGFEKQLTDPKIRQAFVGLGVDVTNAGTMFDSLLRVLSKNPGALEKIEGLPPELGTILRGAVRNADVYKNAMDHIGGDVEALRRSLTARMGDPAVKLGQSTEKLKAAFEPLVTTLLPSLCETVTKLCPLLEGLGKVAAFAADQWEILVGLWLGTKAAAAISRAAEAAAAAAAAAAGGGAAAAGGGGTVAAGAGAGVAAAPAIVIGGAVAGIITSIEALVEPEGETARRIGMRGAAGMASPEGTNAREIIDATAVWSALTKSGLSAAELRAARSWTPEQMQAEVERRGVVHQGGPVGPPQVNITIQQTTNVSPDGTSGTARAQTDDRNAATVQVRDEYSGSYRSRSI